MSTLTIIPIEPDSEAHPLVGTMEERRALSAHLRLAQVSDVLGIVQDLLATLRVGLTWEAEANQFLSHPYDTLLVQLGDHLRVAFVEVQEVPGALAKQVHAEVQAARTAYSELLGGVSMMGRDDLIGRIVDTQKRLGQHLSRVEELAAPAILR